MTHTGDNTIEILEANWLAIREECLAVSGYVDYPEYFIYLGKWDVFGIYDMWGNFMAENAEKCPNTTAVLQQIQGVRTAGFSKLTAGCIVNPHKGFTDKILRYHLGLIIPEGDCGLKVEDTIYRWQEGKAFVFDDRLLHEAWNRTSEPRYVLIVDIYKDAINGKIETN